ncbi:hypothetical protein [Nonomuraea sp. NPDC046570]|uniref:hypothetical protein n=1 Tax=Nonomuraea sp. NPDC046570 TaxID=3155255 RepID=UPI00340F5C42
MQPAVLFASGLAAGLLAGTASCTAMQGGLLAGPAGAPPRALTAVDLAADQACESAWTPFFGGNALRSVLDLVPGLLILVAVLVRHPSPHTLVFRTADAALLMLALHTGDTAAGKVTRFPDEGYPPVEQDRQAAFLCAARVTLSSSRSADLPDTALTAFGRRLCAMSVRGNERTMDRVLAETGMPYLTDETLGLLCPEVAARHLAEDERWRAEEAVFVANAKARCAKHPPHRPADQAGGARPEHHQNQPNEVLTNGSARMCTRGAQRRLACTCADARRRWAPTAKPAGQPCT